MMDPFSFWKRLSGWPAGGFLFGGLLKLMVPYTATIRPRLLLWEPGVAKLSMADRRGVRNHLGSVHAVALANLGEAASGMAVMSRLRADQRAILVKISIDYLKKARGRLVAAGHCPSLPSGGPADVEAVADIHNAEGTAVARVVALWKVGPRA